MNSCAWSFLSVVDDNVAEFSILRVDSDDDNDDDDDRSNNGSELGG